ncbi:polyphosphate kinase [Nitrospira sp.]|nr:polyphosphate kinase [Nitrospira sp.]
MTLRAYRIKPNSKLQLKKFDPSETGPYKKTDRDKKRVKAKTESAIRRIRGLQERLYASGQRAFLLVLQGMDTSGKDSTIKHVMSGVNPQGCRVASFKAPSTREMAHDFLWRIHQAVPPKGYIGIFNRSHYEDVLITRVHGLISDKVARRRFEQIREFEEMLYENGTAIVKVFLYLSKEEQRRRLEARVQDPDKRWKFSLGDLEERKLWDDYMTAFEDVISDTSTEHAPWYVIPADRKWYRNLLVAQIVESTLAAMKLKRPKPAADVDWDRLQIE